MPTPQTSQLPNNLTAYHMKGNLQTEPFKDSRLLRRNESSPFRIFTIGLKGGGKIDKREGFLFETGSLTREKTAVGWFDFVIMTTELTVAYVRRSRDDKVMHGKADPGGARGHSAIARGEMVVFAGQLLFGGDPFLAKRSKSYEGTNPGTLIRWTNKTGHYHVGAQFTMTSADLKTHVAKQTDLLRNEDGKRMLPMDLFEPWDKAL